MYTIHHANRLIGFQLSLSIIKLTRHSKVIYGSVLGHCQGSHAARAHGGGAPRSTPEPTKPRALDHQLQKTTKPSSYSFASRESVMAASSSTAPGSPARAPYRSRFGDTTLTKVFVGGLAWEMPSEGLRQHFEQYGDILEAVVITDRPTGRSKGYGFVTFREPEAARRAVQDPKPTIAGRRANCNIASLGPPRPAQPRGRASPGLHLQAPPPAPQGPPYIARAPPPQMMPHHGPAIYPSQYGYWYPPDYQYQQALMNPRVLQNYYARLYGLASPTASPPYHQYLGYMPTPTPRAVLSPVQQAAGQPFVQHPTAQIQGSFVPVPSLPHNFRLQLPPHAMSILPPNPTGLQSADQAASAAGPTNANNTPGA